MAGIFDRLGKKEKTPRWDLIPGGVTAPKGFQAASAQAQIKYKDRTDMALIYSESPCVSAGVFTTNVVKAAPVLWDRELVQSGDSIHAVIINSGIANACTGKEGMDYCLETAQAAAEAFNVEPKNVLVASTGVIGMQLPMDRIKEGIDLLAGSKEDSITAGDEAAKAIMTTDTVEKQMAVSFMIGNKKCRMGGMCKGSGMIHPNMCTMLAFITTDVSITKELLQKALSEDVQDTFNMISVDGDTSTNDTLVILSNAQAGNPQIKEEGEDYKIFCEALRAITSSLSKKIAGDGEGATALVEMHVKGAATKDGARTLARSVICSSLTKAAIAGHDANWGRILCALGYSGEDFDPEKVDLFIKSSAGDIQIVKKGKATDYSEDEATEILSRPEVTITADMHMGKEEATAYGCDLTVEYVKINGDYRS